MHAERVHVHDRRQAPAVLLFHHTLTLLLLLHSLRHRPHLKYVAWMSTVEINTFFLVLRRHVRHPLIDVLFVTSWIAIRCLWFPYLPLHLALFVRDWPETHALATQIFVAGAVTFLSALQLAWSRKALEPLFRRLREGSGAKDKETGQWL